jgi:hypothetical protein
METPGCIDICSNEMEVQDIRKKGLWKKEQLQIPFDCAQGRLSTHYPQAEENAWGPVRSG